MKTIVRAAFAAAIIAFASGTALGADPVKVDPKHYKVAFENERVRVLRIHYGPHETSVMHSHPDGVVVYLTDGHTRFELPGGKMIMASGKQGEANWAPAGPHKPTNMSEKPMDAVLIELKGK